MNENFHWPKVKVMNNGLLLASVGGVQRKGGCSEGWSPLGFRVQGFIL